MAVRFLVIIEVGKIFTTKQIGDKGEKEAEEYLKKLGWKILEKNWKYSRIGEIDIIGIDNNELVFVEVKYRNNNKFGSAIEAITKQKLDKIYKSALAYLKTTNERYKDFRIDVITIDKTATPPLQHYKNIGY